MNEVLPETTSIENKKNKISIILADDHPLMRQALRNVLEKQADFEIVAEANNGEEVVSLATELVPDVVIMDISMPKLNGIEATRQIKEKNPKIIVLVLTVHDDSQYVLGILEAGAAGYLTKGVFGNEVVHAVRSVVSGETILSKQISQQVLKYALRHATKPIPLGAREKLAARELEILNLVAKGMSNRDIALGLNLSQSTVKGYMMSIFTKLEVGSRTEAVVAGLRGGFITIDKVE